MNGGHLAVAALEAWGVDTIFGIPATHVIEVYDGLRESRGIRTVVARSDQNAAFMADGYARRTRQPGVAVVTGGPGLAQTASGLVTAWADSVPLVVITSDIDAEDRARRQAGIPHEIYDAYALAHSTGAHVFRAEHPDEVYDVVSAALTASTSRRNRPAVCLLARGALSGRTTSPKGLRSSPSARPSREKQEWSAVSRDEVAAVIDALSAAERPLVLVGAGVTAARAEPLVDSLLERTGLPFLTTVPAAAAVDTRRAGYRGVVLDDRSREALASADVVLAIGSSFGWATTGGNTLRMAGQLIHVDIDPDELGKHYQPAVAVTADAAAFLRALLDALVDVPRELGNRPQDVQSGGRNSPGRQQNPWIAAIDRALPMRDVTVIADVTMSQLALARDLTFTPGRTFLVPWNAQTLGYAYPAALGAAAAQWDDFVLAVMGDGGAHYVLGELGTAVEEKLPVCFLVFNNHSYGTIALAQDDMCEGRRFGIQLASPDFCKIAQAFDAWTYRADTPQQLQQVLSEAVEMRQPALIEAHVPFDAFMSTESV